ncbi:MAG: hypothetical protein WC326_03315 [Candidatus Delongbacteria bacterium]
MRHPKYLLALVLPLAFFSGCANTGDEPATQLLQADQLQFVAPPAAKAAQTDTWMDFSLTLHPNRPATVVVPGFLLHAPRGAVEQTLTITGDWCGDDAQDPVVGYDFAPDGSEFLVPLRVMFVFLPQSLEGLDPARLTWVLDHEDGTYEVIPSEVQVLPAHGPGNPGAVRVLAQVEHFSRYLIAIGPPPDNNTTR